MFQDLYICMYVCLYGVRCTLPQPSSPVFEICNGTSLCLVKTFHVLHPHFAVTVSII